MSDDDKQAAKEAGNDVAAHLTDAAVGLAATIASAPVLGPAAPIVGALASGASKALRSLVRSHVETRKAARVEAFEAAVAEALESANTVPDDLAADERFAEAVFQGYRRAMDAVDAAAIEPLGRLTAQFGKEGPGLFFRCCGRFLQDASADELEATRWILHHIFEPEPKRRRRAGQRPVVFGGDSYMPVGWRMLPDRRVVPDAEAAEPVTLSLETELPPSVLAAVRLMGVHGLARVEEAPHRLPTFHIRGSDVHALRDVLVPASPPGHQVGPLGAATPAPTNGGKRDVTCTGERRRGSGTPRGPRS